MYAPTTHPTMSPYFHSITVCQKRNTTVYTPYFLSNFHSSSSSHQTQATMYKFYSLNIKQNLRFQKGSSRKSNCICSVRSLDMNLLKNLNTMNEQVYGRVNVAFLWLAYTDFPPHVSRQNSTHQFKSKLPPLINYNIKWSSAV